MMKSSAYALVFGICILPYLRRKIRHRRHKLSGRLSLPVTDHRPNCAPEFRPNKKPRSSYDTKSDDFAVIRTREGYCHWVKIDKAESTLK